MSTIRPDPKELDSISRAMSQTPLDRKSQGKAIFSIKEKKLTLTYIKNLSPRRAVQQFFSSDALNLKQMRDYVKDNKEYLSLASIINKKIDLYNKNPFHGKMSYLAVDKEGIPYLKKDADDSISDHLAKTSLGQIKSTDEEERKRGFVTIKNLIDFDALIGRKPSVQININSAVARLFPEADAETRANIEHKLQLDAFEALANRIQLRMQEPHNQKLVSSWVRDDYALFYQLYRDCSKKGDQHLLTQKLNQVNNVLPSSMQKQ